jgi:plasmid maintenance system antidote protein VapI
MANLQDLSKKIAEIERQLSSLGSTGKSLQPAVDALKAAANNTAELDTNLQKAEDLLELINDRVDSLNADLKYTLKSFQSIIGEMTKGRNNINIIKSSTRELSSITSKLLDYQSGISDYSIKELKSLQQKAKEEFASLKRSQEDLKLRKNQNVATQEELDALNNITTFLEKNNKLEEIFGKQIGIAITRQQKVEESLGVTGNILKGISELPGISALGRHLNVDDAVKSMQDYTKGLIEAAKQAKSIDFAVADDNIRFFSNEIEKIQDQLKDSTITQTHRKKLENDLVKLTKELNKHLEKKVELENEATAAATGYKAKIGALKEGFKSLAEGVKKGLTDPMVIVGAIVKGFNSLNEAQTEFTRQTGRDIEHFDTINGSLISSSDYIKQATSMTKQFGIAADAVFSKETLQEAAEMVTLMGMSAEEAGNMARLSKLSNKELKSVNHNIVEQVGNFNKVNRTGVNQRQVLEAVANTSDHIAMTFGGNPEKIAEAVSEAKKLGLTLEQVDKIADSLLQFESSISAELEAELLTGKELNLEQARYYALTNQLTELTKEIGENQEFINNFAEAGRIEQESIAKALGMSRDEVAKMIFDQRMINGLSEEQLEKVMGMSAEDMKRLSLQESINKAIQKMTEALAGPLEMFASLLSNSAILYTTIGLIAAVQIPKLIQGFGALGKLAKMIRIQEMGAAIMSGLKAAFSSPASLLTGGAIGLAAGAGIAAFIMSQNKKAEQVEDGIIPSGGPVISKFNKGQLTPVAQGLKEDNVILTTNKPTSSGGGGGGGDNTNELRAIKELLANIATKTGTVMLDGKQVGRVMTSLVNTENIKTETQIS